MREAVIVVAGTCMMILFALAVLIEFRPDPPTDIEQWEEELSG